MLSNEGPWIGASGAEYDFHVFDIDAETPQRTGSYIYSKKNIEGLWVPVYIGCGDLSKRCIDSKRLACIRGKGATHLHLRLSTIEEAQDEIKDLLGRYRNAFPPDGCNDM